MSTSPFTWNRTVKKLGRKLSTFDVNSDDESDETIVKNSSSESPDFNTRIKRIEKLKSNGITCAENDKFWQAMNIWSGALEELSKLTASSFQQHELMRKYKVDIGDMFAQSLIQVHEWDEAISLMKDLVANNPLWADGYQTLGRAMLGKGDISNARQTFKRAVHLTPHIPELMFEDLLWANQLFLKQSQRGNVANGEM